MSVHGFPVLGVFNTPGGSLDGYLSAARQTGVATDPPEGLALHWSASVPEGMLAGSLWRSRGEVERFFASALSGAITEVAHQSAASGTSGPDYSYELHPVDGLAVGEISAEFAGRGLGEAAGAVLERGPASELKDPPDGLIMRALFSTAEGPSAYGFWTSAEVAPCDEGDEVIELHTLFTVPEVLDRL